MKKEKTLYKRDPLTDAVISEISDDFHPDILMALLYASRRMFFDMGLERKNKTQEDLIEAVKANLK